MPIILVYVALTCVNECHQARPRCWERNRWGTRGFLFETLTVDYKKVRIVTMCMFESAHLSRHRSEMYSPVKLKKKKKIYCSANIQVGCDSINCNIGGCCKCLLTCMDPFYLLFYTQTWNIVSVVSPHSADTWYCFMTAAVCFFYRNWISTKLGAAPVTLVIIHRDSL